MTHAPHPMSMREAIDMHVECMGTLRAVSRALQIDVGYLSRLHRGEKTEPSEDVLLKLGLRRIVMYLPLEKQ